MNDELRLLYSADCRIVRINVYNSNITAKLELKMSGHCVSSWSDQMISRAIKSTIPPDAADVDPRQYTSWLSERSSSASSSGVPVNIPGKIVDTSNHMKN